MEGVAAAVVDDRCRAGTKLGEEGIGICVVQKSAVFSVNPELVHITRCGALQETLPEFPVFDAVHRALLPAAEGADDGGIYGMRRIRAEDNPLIRYVRAEIFIGFKFFSIVKILNIHKFFHP